MDPDYIVVQFGPDGVPENYRQRLDAFNAVLGGAPVGNKIAGWSVRASGAGNLEPIQFVDATMINLNFLFVNSGPNANIVAKEIHKEWGLHAWVIRAQQASVYC